MCAVSHQRCIWAETYSDKDKLPYYCSKCKTYIKAMRYMFYGKIGLFISAIAFIISTIMVYG